MNQWTHESINQWLNESVNQWTKGFMNQWNLWMSYLFVELLLHWSLHCCAQACQCVLSHSSIVHNLRTWSSKSAPRTAFFLPFGKFWKCKSSSRYSPVRCLSTTFPDRGPHPLKQRPFFGDTRSQITRQTNIGGFRAQTCFHPWIHTRLTWWVVMWWCGDVLWWVNHPHVGRASWAIKVTWFL